MKMNIIFAALVALLVPSAASADERVSESLAYRAYVGGLPLGTLKLNISMDQKRYATDARFDMTSFLRFILDTDARASSNGALQSGEARPVKFDYWVRDRKKVRTSEVLFDPTGNPIEVLADPPFNKKPYDMAIEQARGAVDPATAVALLSAPRPEACNLDMTVYDGRKLHGISLRPAKRQSKNADISKCVGRYERLAGI